MYVYTDFDRRFVRERAAQFRDQLERHLRGELSAEDFRPLRQQNGWYLQRHAPMLRVAIPYGVLASRQLRQLAVVAREFDRGVGHFTTRQNMQFNWIELPRAADAMDRLAEADLHGIQTSGNCVRNTTTDALAGVAADEIVDPRPYCELIRQWSTLHPEFAFLPRKFKIAVSGSADDRAATGWHDIGLQLHRDDAGAVGFRVLAGGGMGRTPIIATTLREFVPWQQILCYLEAAIRVYNRCGRRDNLFKSRIKILVRSEGQRYIDAVEAEFARILAHDLDGPLGLIAQAEYDRIAASFVRPAAVRPEPEPSLAAPGSTPYARWLARNVHAHQVSGRRAVTLSLKRAGQAPGDLTADQMDAAAEIADRFSLSELRVTHEQNLVLPWVRAAELTQLYAAARAAGFATPNVGLVSDLIACPGGDYCALANARSLPIAAALTERFADLDLQFDIGELALHMSGCINSCGHHHSGHIGILGVDKDGDEWYQVTIGGSDGRAAGGPAVPGKVIGPAFAAEEVPDVVEALIDTYRSLRAPGERFIDTVRRADLAPFRAAADAQRSATAPGRELAPA